MKELKLNPYVKEVMETLKTNDYELYNIRKRLKYPDDLGDTSAEGNTSSYFYAVSPSGSIMYFEHSNIWGWNTSVQYRPSRKNGGGCSDGDYYESFSTEQMTIEKIEELLNRDIRYARRLKATFYSSVEQWLKAPLNQDIYKLN